MHDLAIIGGGPVGLCAALALRHRADRIGVIEAADLRRAEATGLNARSIALSWSSRQIFRALGVWSEIEAAATPIRHIHISARGRWGVTRLAAADYDLDALGYVIESQALMRCLLDAVDADDRIELLESTSFDSLEDGSPVRLGYRRQEAVYELQAGLVLIADGAQSAARAALGIGHETRDYGQTVLICNVETDQRERAGLTSGLRVRDRWPCCRWAGDVMPVSGPSTRPVRRRWSRPTRRLLSPRCRIPSVIDSARSNAAVTGFLLPLRRTRADSLYRGNCIVIGNAANALHPRGRTGFQSRVARRGMAV